MSVSRSLRYQVLRRDNHTCRYCGRSAPEVKLAIDHVIPAALGGSDEASNLVTACVDCNGGKAATPPDAALVSDVEEMAVRWAAAMRFASAHLAGLRAQRDEIREAFEDAWNGWTYTDAAGEKKTVDLPTSWPNSIDSLANAGLKIEDIEDCVDVAMRTEKVQDRFRYFCGVAWRTVRELQDQTRRIIEYDECKAAEPEAEPQTGTSRIRCPECAATVEIVVEVLPTHPDEPIRLRSQPIAADPWRTDQDVAPLSQHVTDLFGKWQS